MLRWAPARDSSNYKWSRTIESFHVWQRGRIPTQLYLPNVSGLRILFESVYRRTPKRLPIGIIVSAVQLYSKTCYENQMPFNKAVALRFVRVYGHIAWHTCDERRMRRLSTPYPLLVLQFNDDKNAVTTNARHYGLYSREH